MKRWIQAKQFFPVCLLLLTAVPNAFAQTVTITTPTADTIIIVTNDTLHFEASRSGFFPGGRTHYTFAWQASPSNGVSFNPPSSSGNITTASTIATFSQPGTYSITCRVRRGSGPAFTSAAKTVIVFTPNLYSAVNINPVRAWTVNPVTGAVIQGPVELFNPLANTAALAKNRVTATDPDGCLYYLENTNFSNTGNVNLFAVRPNGTGNSFIGTADINGASSSGLGFVRLGFDALGQGWIVAGDFTNLYLARFTGNGTSPTTITTVGTISISGAGSANEFQNGDLAISGTGAMYIVANVTGGDTYVYVMNSLSGPTYTLTRRWRLVQPGGANFTVSVNGVAFTQSGSLHVSSFQGLYFIDQTTANSSTGTVECVPVYTLEGLTDLASDQFPVQSALPVTLLNFSASLRNNIATLTWESENEINFSHYEIERRSSAGSYMIAGSRSPAASNSSRRLYQFTDNLSAMTGKVFFYRLKIIDLDGTYKYSREVMVRKEDNMLTGLHISPNPLQRPADATIRFHAATTGWATIRLTDMSGKICWEQQNRVSSGINSLALQGITKLIPGMYTLQVISGEEILGTKLSVLY